MFPTDNVPLKNSLLLLIMIYLDYPFLQNTFGIIDFGSIQNDGSENDIVIQFELIVVNSSQFVHAMEYSVNANVSLNSYTVQDNITFIGIEQDLVSWLRVILM